MTRALAQRTGAHEMALRVGEVCHRLGIGKSSFYENLARYRARGLKVVRVPGAKGIRVLSSSVDRMLERLAED